MIELAAVRPFYRLSLEKQLKNINKYVQGIFFRMYYKGIHSCWVKKNIKSVQYRITICCRFALVQDFFCYEIGNLNRLKYGIKIDFRTKRNSVTDKR